MSQMPNQHYLVRYNNFISATKKELFMNKHTPLPAEEQA
jgi:hypothetical protein